MKAHSVCSALGEAKKIKVGQSAALSGIYGENLV